MRRLCHHKSESQIQILKSQEIEQLDVKEAKIVETGLDLSAGDNGSYLSPTSFFFA